jgi:DNA-binding NarL/FixJ family response regulator
MILVQFTPEGVSDDHQALVGAQWKLTPLTAKVLEGVAAGDATVRLAAKLFLSRQGIEYHVSLLLRQFKVPNRTALAAKAYSMGMFGIGCWPPRVLPDFIRAERKGAERGGDDARAEARRP